MINNQTSVINKQVLFKRQWSLDLHLHSSIINFDLVINWWQQVKRSISLASCALRLESQAGATRGERHRSFQLNNYILICKYFWNNRLDTKWIRRIRLKKPRKLMNINHTLHPKLIYTDYICQKKLEAMD